MSKGGLQASRRAVLSFLASACAVAAAPVYANAPGLLRGVGDERRIRLQNARTGEALDTVYWADGAYIGEALTEISFFMRDWRQNEVRQYHPAISPTPDHRSGAAGQTQIRAFLCVVAVASTAAALTQIMMRGEPVEPAFRAALFNIMSVITTTGYATTDYCTGRESRSRFSLWPQ